MRALAALLVLVAWPAAAALVGHGGPVTGIAISNDGGTAVSAGFDGKVIVWDLPSGSARARLEGHDAPLTSIDLSTGIAVSGADDGVAIIWDIVEGRVLRRLCCHAGKIADVALGPDGTIATAGWDETIRWWSRDGIELRRVAVPQRPTAISFASAGDLLMLGHQGGLYRLVERVDPLHDRGGLGLTRLEIAGDVAAVAGVEGVIRLLDPALGIERRQLAVGQPVTALAIDPAGRVLASAAVDGTVQLWRPGDGTALRTLGPFPAPIWALAIDDDGTLYAGGRDGMIRTIDTTTGNERDAIAPVAAAVDDGSRGAKLFRACRACHTLTWGSGNRAGPSFRHLVGRPAAAVADYRYSAALRASRIVWDEAALDDLLARGPHEMVPGSKMPLQRITNADDRRALIAYLRRASGQGAVP